MSKRTAKSGALVFCLPLFGSFINFHGCILPAAPFSAMRRARFRRPGHSVPAQSSLIVSVTETVRIRLAGAQAASTAEAATTSRITASAPTGQRQVAYGKRARIKKP